jgi:uncharacterized protein
MPLRGVRIWLSGAVPLDATEAQRATLLKFVEDFAAAVFKMGGHVLHGSHPSFTPTLLRVAKAHIAIGGRKDCLTLAVSRHYSKDTNAVPVRDWREICSVYETPEATGDSPRDESLVILRQWMSERCDAFVAAGGMWWKELPGRAGIPLEAGLAFERGIPAFLLGGLGGAVQDYINNHPSLISRLKNGLDDATNRALALEENVGGVVQSVCEQLVRLPLVRGRVVDGISFRVLALDGGGIKGAFTASVLATLEDSLGSSIADHFDLIAGTSTGGILAIGLGMGLSAKQMLDFYRKRGTVIFPITSFHQNLPRRLLHMFRPKYSQHVLLRELESAYFPVAQTGAQTSLWKRSWQWFLSRFQRKHYVTKALGDSICRLVIPAYDAISGACHTFRTPHHSLLKADEFTNAAEVALATAAAPTYFSSAKVRNMIANSSYVDGGVWANSPAMAAIIEAVCYLDVSLDRVDILSVGTTEEPFTVKQFGRSGWLRWGRNLLDLLMNAQLASSIEHAERLVGSPRFLRINTVTPQGMYKLDGSEEIDSLIALGNKTASNISILGQVKSRFLNGIASIPWKDT